MRAVRGGMLLALTLVVLTSAAVAGNDPGVSVQVVLQSNEVDAGSTVTVGAVVKNTGDKDRFVIVEGFLSPVAEPIGTPPASRWERFVWLLLAKITGDCKVLHVPTGQTRAAVLEIEVHPRMHGRFDVVATAQTTKGVAVDRASVISKITAPPSGGGVLVHGKLYRLGPCRLLVTDDGHIYEPKGTRADWMFDLLDDLYPAPDGVTVLGGILPNTLGCFGVELEVDVFRFDREPGQAIGYRWRTFARGRSSESYSGPDEEIVRSKSRLKEIIDALNIENTGRRPNFRKEMVAVVTTAASSLTHVRVRRVFEKDGVLQVHYQVVNALPGHALVEAFSQPYHLVVLPKFRGAIRFVRHDIKVRSDAYRTGILDVAESLDLVAAQPDAKKLDKALEKSPALRNAKVLDRR